MSCHVNHDMRPNETSKKKEERAYTNINTKYKHNIYIKSAFNDGGGRGSTDDGTQNY